MKIGDLVTVRLDETGMSRFLLLGLIIRKIIPDDQRPKSPKILYEILTRGEVVTVTNNDLGPIEMIIARYNRA